MLRVFVFVIFVFSFFFSQESFSKELTFFEIQVREAKNSNFAFVSRNRKRILDFSKEFAILLLRRNEQILQKTNSIKIKIYDPYLRLLKAEEFALESNSFEADLEKSRYVAIASLTVDEAASPSKKMIYRIVFFDFYLYDQKTKESILIKIDSSDAEKVLLDTSFIFLERNTNLDRVEIKNFISKTAYSIKKD